MDRRLWKRTPRRPPPPTFEARDSCMRPYLLANKKKLGEFPQFPGTPGPTRWRSIFLSDFFAGRGSPLTAKKTAPPAFCRCPTFFLARFDRQPSLNRSRGKKKQEGKKSRVIGGEFFADVSAGNLLLAWQKKPGRTLMGLRPNRGTLQPGIARPISNKIFRRSLTGALGRSPGPTRFRASARYRSYEGKKPLGGGNFSKPAGVHDPKKSTPFFFCPPRPVSPSKFFVPIWDEVGGPALTGATLVEMKIFSGKFSRKGESKWRLKKKTFRRGRSVIVGDQARKTARCCRNSVLGWTGRRYFDAFVRGGRTGESGAKEKKNGGLRIGKIRGKRFKPPFGPVF